MFHVQFVPIFFFIYIQFVKQTLCRKKKLFKLLYSRVLVVLCFFSLHTLYAIISAISAICTRSNVTILLFSLYINIICLQLEIWYIMKNSRSRTAMACVLSARRRRVVSGARKIKYIMVKVGKSLKSRVRGKKQGVRTVESSRN